MSVQIWENFAGLFEARVRHGALKLTACFAAVVTHTCLGHARVVVLSFSTGVVDRSKVTISVSFCVIICCSLMAAFHADINKHYEGVNDSERNKNMTEDGAATLDNHNLDIHSPVRWSMRAPGSDTFWTIVQFSAQLKMRRCIGRLDFSSVFTLKHWMVIWSGFCDHIVVEAVLED